MADPTDYGHKRLKEALLTSTLNCSDWAHPVAATLRCRPIIAAGTPAAIRLTEGMVREGARRTMRKLERRLFGNNRAGKKLRRVVVIEHDGAVGWHLHVLIDRPSDRTSEEFRRAIIDCWEDWDGAASGTWVQEGADRGWLHYMLKRRTKEKFEGPFDAIVLEATVNDSK